MREARVRATAYPKLTLSLRVLGRRADGFHDLEALVVSLGQPNDALEAFAVPAPGGVRVELVRDGTADNTPDDIPSDHRNLAFIAAEKLLVRAGRSGHGSGWCCANGSPRVPGWAAVRPTRRRRSWSCGASSRSTSTTRGSWSSPPRSVPTSRSACAGAAWMRGRGDEIEPLALPHGLGFLVAIPPFRLSTPDVYKMWDRLGGPRAERAVEAPRRINAVAAELSNDLEPAAEAIEPRLREFRTALEKATGRRALLAGSGSAYVVPVTDARSLPALVEQVRRRMRVPVVGTTSVARGVRLAP